MIRWLVRKLGVRNLIALLLLTFVVQFAAWGIALAVRGIESGQVGTISTAGMLIGYVFARSRSKGWQAGLIIIPLSMFGAVYFSASLADPLSALARSIWAVLSAWRWEVPIDFTSLQPALLQLDSQLSQWLEQLWTWLAAIGQGEMGYDDMAVELVWGLAFWFLFMWAAWAVFRLSHPLAGIAPIGALLAGTLNFTNSKPLLLLPVAGSTLLLMALSRYDRQERHWLTNHIDFAEDIRLDLGVNAGLLVLLLMVGAFLAPTLSVQQAIELTRRLISGEGQSAESLAESFGLEQASGGEGLFEGWRTPGLPRQHLLGAGQDLEQNVVMIVQVECSGLEAECGYPAMPPEGSSGIAGAGEAGASAPHYYWRSATYDIYTGRGWATSDTQEVAYLAGQPALMGDIAGNDSFLKIVQQVRFIQDSGGMLYAAGQLLTADRRFQVSWRIFPEENLSAGQPVADAFSASLTENHYQAESLLVNPSLEQLRLSSAEYPAWVSQRYLTLPADLPQRVYDLAEQLTSGEQSPYDRAATIQDYLRTYTYTLDIPAPPPSRDVADYFLFDLRQGYCDYYATAMVVLARAAGLPARLVSGYASGLYDEASARYVVTEANAHSWVEVYFSGLGWVEFEPTAARPAIFRRSNPAETLAGLDQLPDLQPAEPATLADRLRLLPWLKWGISIATISLLGIALWLGSDLWRLNRLPSPVALQRIYQRLLRKGPTLAVPTYPGVTPHEYSSLLTSHLSFHTSQHRHFLMMFLIPFAGEVAALVELFTKATYSPHPVSDEQRHQAVRTWGILRWRLAFGKWVVSYHRWRKR